MVVLAAAVAACTRGGIAPERTDTQVLYGWLTPTWDPAGAADADGDGVLESWCDACPAQAAPPASLAGCP